MTKRWSSYGVVTAMALAQLPLAGSALAQTAPRTVYFYNAAMGRASAALNAAKPAAWGNGDLGNDRRVDYEGAPVLRVTTRNLQEGVRFDLKNPVSIDDYHDTGFLRFRLRFNAGFGGFGGGGGFGGFGGGGFGGGGFGGGGFGGGGFGGRGGRGGRGRGGGGGGGGDVSFQTGDGNATLFPVAETTGALLKPHWEGSAQFNGALPQFGGVPGGGIPGGDPNAQGGVGPDGAPTAAQAPQRTSITQIQVTMLRDNGTTTGRIPINLRSTTPDEDGWRLFVLPVREMTSTPGATGPVKRVILTSDNEDTFYIAQAALVIESGNMTVTIRRPSDEVGAQMAEIQVKPGPVTLVADVEAGAADPVVEWNFDADNVGNLPPGAISNPAAAAGIAGEVGGPGLPGAGGPGAIDPEKPGAGFAPPGFPGAPGPDGTTTVGPVIGPRIDSRGLSATFPYPNEEQDYRVEVTVRDRSGQKAPVKASILVKVRG